jgi:hypothetical protein
MEEKKQAKETLSMDEGRKVSLIMREIAWLLISLLSGNGLERKKREALLRATVS